MRAHCTMARTKLKTRPDRSSPLSSRASWRCQASRAQQPPTPRPRVLAFFTVGGELDHVLFAQQAMRALAAGAADGGYTFTATTVVGRPERREPPRRAAGDLAERHAAARRRSARRSSATWPAAARGSASMSPASARPRGRGSPRSWAAAGSAPATGRRCRRASTSTTPRTRSSKGVPPTFVAPINEWYAWTPSPRVNPDVKVLLTLDASNFPLGVKNTHQRRRHPGGLDQHQVPDGVSELRPRRPDLLHAGPADDDRQQRASAARPIEVVRVELPVPVLSDAPVRPCPPRRGG